MRPLFTFLFVFVATSCAWSQAAHENFVFIEGGLFQNTKSAYHGKNVRVSSFYLGKYEVTQKEWREVMGTNPSKFKGDDLPVETVSWYDCVEYCNQRSRKEGLEPCYRIYKFPKDTGNESEIDDIKWTVTINPRANGYRLPTEAEWEYAAGGGLKTKSYRYSGADDVEQVAWYWTNSGDKKLTGFWSRQLIEENHNRTKPIGRKDPNELGLYDMSGNVREWCWDWLGEPEANRTDPQGSPVGAARVWKGGGWLGGDFCCEISFRGSFEASGKGPDQGLRICRSK